MIAVELKDWDPKITWEIVGIYRAPKEDKLLFEKLADRTGQMRRTTMPSVIEVDLSLLYADWNGQAEKSRGTQVFLSRLVWENGYTQVTNSPTQGMLYWMFTLSGPKLLSLLAVTFRGSVTIAGYS
jgi:hypothetical protein